MGFRFSEDTSVVCLTSQRGLLLKLKWCVMLWGCFEPLVVFIRHNTEEKVVPERVQYETLVSAF